MPSDIDRIIATMYRCAAKADWQPLLQQIHRHYRANRVLNIGVSFETQLPVFFSTTKFQKELMHFRKVIPQDPMVRASRSIALGKAYTDRQVISRKELTSSWFYQEFYVPAQVGHIMAANALNSDSAMASLIINRPFKAEPFSQQDLSSFQRIADHCQPAIEIYLQALNNKAETSFYQKCMEHAGHAMVLLDNRGMLLHANPAAESIMDRYPLFNRHSGTLLATDDNVNRNLKKAFRAITQSQESPAPQSVEIPACKDWPQILVRMAPYYDDTPFAHHYECKVLVSIYANDRTQLEFAASHFGLTKAETQVAAMLLNGLEKSEIAEQLFRSPETIKTHIKNLMTKTGTHSQHSLVSTLSLYRH
ncbi:helix-turn-helix transcriptional regulator [Parasalinivibrio latis]|uniref:helix-turn-helix transcriptional regulator n=1 Tax=Parasalinivibrio latis TaxID=2952610 RepID=UPI0030DE3221